MYCILMTMSHIYIYIYIYINEVKGDGEEVVLEHCLSVSCL